MIIDQPPVDVEIIQSVSGANVTLRITYEFNTFTTTELIEIIEYDMNLMTIGNLSVASAPNLIVFESTGTVISIHVHT